MSKAMIEQNIEANSSAKLWGDNSNALQFHDVMWQRELIVNTLICRTLPCDE